MAIWLLIQKKSSLLAEPYLLHLISAEYYGLNFQYFLDLLIRINVYNNLLLYLKLVH